MTSVGWSARQHTLEGCCLETRLGRGAAFPITLMGGRERSHQCLRAYLGCRTGVPFQYNWPHQLLGVESAAVLVFLVFVSTSSILRPVSAILRGPHCDHTPSVVGDIVAVLLDLCRVKPYRIVQLVHDLKIDPLVRSSLVVHVAIVVVVEVRVFERPGGRFKRVGGFRLDCREGVSSAAVRGKHQIYPGDWVAVDRFRSPDCTVKRLETKLRTFVVVLITAAVWQPANSYRV